MVSQWFNESGPAANGCGALQGGCRWLNAKMHSDECNGDFSPAGALRLRPDPRKLLHLDSLYSREDNPSRSIGVEDEFYLLRKMVLAPKQLTRTNSVTPSRI